MAKFLATDVKVKVNNVDLSDHADSVDTPEESEQVDVSGFSPTRTREFLAGLSDQTIEVEFLQDFASSKVHATLQPLYSSGTSFPMSVQPDSDAGTSAPNPIFGGLLANDPTCIDALGLYRWRLEEGQFVLEAIDDPCAFQLRDMNLTQQPWQACRPPNFEAL